MKKALITALLAVFTASAFADVTFATFADPSGTSTNPVFNHDLVAKTLKGEWTQPGLTLVAPGLVGAPTLTNVTFETSLFNLVEVASGVHHIGTGSIVFRDSAAAELFTISFTNGTYVEGLGAGASELRASNIDFTGPQVPAGTDGKQFSFAFANQVTTTTNTTYTASFTSSAVPEPASMIALGAGLAALAARRRKA